MILIYPILSKYGSLPTDWSMFGFCQQNLDQANIIHYQDKIFFNPGRKQIPGRDQKLFISQEKEIAEICVHIFSIRTK